MILTTMHKIILLAIVVIAAVSLWANPAVAQTGIPSVGGMGAMQQTRPHRKLHRNRSPALSPALNLVPGVVNSFEGQFLMRQLPQEQALRSQSQALRRFESVEGQLRVQDVQIRTGLGKSGHVAGYLTYGRYYQLNATAGRH